jgi:hypothetical protein
MKVGCTSQKVNNVETPLTAEDIQKLGCRPDDQIDKSYVADSSEPGKFTQGGKEYLKRAPKTFRNTVTGWWDASQLYGYDERSRQRVKRDPNDRAKMLLAPIGSRTGDGEKLGYLPVFEAADPILPQWSGQEAAAFPDNWTIGLSFYHNLFAREHNLFVDEFRKQAVKTPEDDSGLRNPAAPDRVIRYKDVSADELFEAARLVVAAEIAKIHTTEWTPQSALRRAALCRHECQLERTVATRRARTKPSPTLFARLCSTTTENRKTSRRRLNGIRFSLPARASSDWGAGGCRRSRVRPVQPEQKDIWDIKNPNHVNGGVNHFGSPFNFPEEFITVYRLHALVPT